VHHNTRERRRERRQRRFSNRRARAAARRIASALSLDIICATGFCRCCTPMLNMRPEYTWIPSAVCQEIGNTTAHPCSETLSATVAQSSCFLCRDRRVRAGREIYRETLDGRSPLLRPPTPPRAKLSEGLGQALAVTVAAAAADHSRGGSRSAAGRRARSRISRNPVATGVRRGDFLAHFGDESRSPRRRRVFLRRLRANHLDTMRVALHRGPRCGCHDVAEKVRNDGCIGRVSTPCDQCLRAHVHIC